MANYTTEDTDIHQAGPFLVYNMENTLKPEPDFDSNATSEVESYIPSGVQILNKSRTNYSTRILFIILIITGIALIATGVGLLITCRNHVNIVSCDVTMDRQPCTSLATATYMGCAIILITIFGFGCVGRKAIACLLLCVLLVELTFGIYLVVKTRASLAVELSDGLETAEMRCLALTENVQQHIVCWEHLSTQHLECVDVSNKVIKSCNNTESPNKTVNPQSKADTSLDNCATSLNNDIVQVVWKHLLIEGPILLAIAPIHLVIAAWLWLIRFSHGSLRYEMRFKSAMSSCFSHKTTENQLAHEKTFETLINENAYRPPPLQPHPYAKVLSQKYIIKKLSTQQNTYNTV